MKTRTNITEEDLKMKRITPFKVPGNYFDDLPARIQERIAAHSTSRFIRVYDFVRPKLAYAAMFVGLIITGYIGMKIITHNPPENGLTADEIMDAIEYYGYDFDDEMFISAMLESNADFFTEETDAETEAIIEYLAEDEIDFSEYMDEY